MCVALAGILGNHFFLFSLQYLPRPPYNTTSDFRADNQKTKLLKIFENNDVP